MSWDKSEAEKQALFEEIALDDDFAVESDRRDRGDKVRCRSEGKKAQASGRTPSMLPSDSGSPRKFSLRPQDRPATVLQEVAPLKAPTPQPACLSHVNQSRTVARSITRSPARSLKPSKVIGQKTNATMPRGRGEKRKREQPIQVLPEHRQYLKGLHLFFVHEQEIGPRKIQIRKVQEWGGIYEKSWTDNVTHIIADADLTHGQVVVYIEKNVVRPMPDNVAIVKYDEYVMDCTKFGYQPDAHLSHYRLPGYKEHLASKAPRPPSDHDDDKAISIVDQPLIAPSVPVMGGNATLQRDESIPDSLPNSLAISSIPVSQGTFDDNFNNIVKEARAIKDLPLDFDDDESEPDKMLAEDSGEESEDERPASRSKASSFQKSGQANFACMSNNEGTPKESNPNAHTISVLEKMCDVYSRVNDQWRTIAYRKAISQLKKQNTRITTKQQARQLPFVGDRRADKIQEIATTHRLRRLENAMLEPEERALRTFLGIYGVGAMQAHRWIEQGYRTLTDLTDHKVPLTPYQKVGLAHYDDFATRIPREEMHAHNRFVQRFVSKIDPTLELTIGGSYRRGEASSGDIDFIVTKPGADEATISTIMLDRVIPLLYKADYLKAGLSTAAHNPNGDSGTKWHGACALPVPKKKMSGGLDAATDSAAAPSSGFPEASTETTARPWRRIDFLFTAHESIGAALLYFTGDEIFNRSMRLLANKKGMRLNQRGLYKDVIRGPRRSRQTDGSKVEGFDERKIFAALGVPWREPTERRC